MKVKVATVVGYLFDYGGNMTPIKPMHPSRLKSYARTPKGMSQARLPVEIREMVESEALAIFADMSNAGCSLQQTLAAIFLSGMNAAKDAGL